MTTQEVANRLVDLCRQGKYEEVYQELYSPEIESIEPEGGTWDHKVKGFDALAEKGKRWQEMVQEFHSGEVTDPIVAENFFTCAMRSKVTFKGMDAPTDFEELCMYRVENGKVVMEQFFYTPMPQEV